MKYFRIVVILGLQGAGTHHLRMSDLSTYFHLSVVDAAKKLGVSQTTLKKACRKFGLKRWPGRKVMESCQDWLRVSLFRIYVL